MRIVRSLFLYTLLFASVVVQAQNLSQQEQYEEFRKRAHADFATSREKNEDEYRRFREEANARYADFVREAWAVYKGEPAIPIPYESPVVTVPPVIDTVAEPRPPRLDPIPHEVVINVPDPVDQPKPVVPIYELPQPVETYHEFLFYGTPCKVRIDSRHAFELPSIDENAIAQQWIGCSDEIFDNLIRDCLRLRIEMNLCDYAYLQLLDTLAESFLGKDTNEAAFLMAFLYCQTGYKMRLGRTEDNSRLVMFFSSMHTIFNLSYYVIDDMRFYPYGVTGDNFYISDAVFDNEQPMSLVLTSSPLLGDNCADARRLASHRYPDVVASTVINKNLIDFYSTYPISSHSGNVMTQWAVYANTPVSKTVKQTLYVDLKQKIAGLSPVEAVSRLLDWVQTGFEYRLDKEEWGKERIFFADETLFYPYCDCEDRSILFTRLVRDLVGLDAVLVYYPGHLAAAVAFPNEVEGDYFNFEGDKYFVCDPTYIGASVGMTMPQVANLSAKLIKLN